MLPTWSSSSPVRVILQGNRENYGDPGNSLIPAVLLTGRGIPLTLCVIHAAVGRRAGLNITGAVSDIIP